jgi:hypothetical protein
MTEPNFGGEFDSWNFSPAKPTPGPSTIQKIGPSTLDPWLDRNSRASEYDEPSNEELGIVPYRGWRLAAGWLIAFIASLGIALGVGKAMLWAFA